MTKLSFFDVDEKQQVTLSKEFTGEKTFELSFNQRSINKHTTCIAKEAEGIIHIKREIWFIR
jgi:hypothetical protein